MEAFDRATQPRRDTSYELVTHLASGGMAELFIARRHDDPEAPHVVLKRVMPEQARNPHFVGMFLDEARLASRLHHPNIAAVLDVGRAGSSYYYTMEYVHGENVRDLLQLAVTRRVMVPIDVCVSVLIGAATGLHAAHETRDRNGKPLGIVHRDVSPSNVMISYEGAIKLVDFGVAKAADHTTETQSGTVKGKIAYLSPEQCTVKPVDRRSDVFSLGIVAWEMVTRSRLFRRRSDYETMHAIVNDAVTPPSRLRADLPPAIEAVILRALERAPGHRQQSAAELADELAAAAASLGMAIGAPVLARFMASLFGSRPLPWAHLEHHDTAVIALAALAPQLVGAQSAPLEESVSGAEIELVVDQAQSSSIDQAFAAVITTIAPPPREWGVGDEQPGVFTWPSRDEGVETVESTETSAPARPAFVATDTDPSGSGELARPTAERPAARTTEERDAASTMKLGKQGAWLDEVNTTIEDRAQTARRMAAARAERKAEVDRKAEPRAERRPDPRPENPGPPDTVLDLREGPPHQAIDLPALRRAAGLSDAPPSRSAAPAPAVTPAVAADDPFDARTTSRPAPRALSTDRDVPAVAPPTAAAAPMAVPAPAPPPKRSRTPSQPNLLPARDASGPRSIPPPRDPGSDPRLHVPPARDASGPRSIPPARDASGPRSIPPLAAPPAPSPLGSVARLPAHPPGYDSSPGIWRPPQHRGTGPNPLLSAPAPERRPPGRRVALVIGLGALAGGGLAIGAHLALRSPDRAAEAAPMAPALTAPSGAEQLEGLRGQARAARDGDRWDQAYAACRDGLRLAPSDVELTTICAHAACATHDPDAANLYLRRVPAADVGAVRARCHEAASAEPRLR